VLHRDLALESTRDVVTRKMIDAASAFDVASDARRRSATAAPLDERTRAKR